MLTLTGYETTELIYDGTRTLVYRGVKTEDSKRVIIKKLRKEYPTFNELLQFRHQYVLSKNLDLPGIVKPLALEKYGNGYVLVMEDVGGVSLSEYYSDRPLGIEEFFTVAISVTKILEDLYRNRVIHKDIKPTNILINPDTKEVFLIDFSISSLLPRETQEIQNPNILEGTLAYISPEQTGRMNRGIDYRSDFYSLGISFYQLLTGEMPFKSDDPMELVHCHIAREPIPPHQVKPEIPMALSEIAMKLMAKTAEERYQSALGIKHDLEKCWQQWQETGSIAEFKLGERDISDRFLIPERLYGREAEVETLLSAFDRVASGGKEMMLVAGFSGIGKTAVVNEVHKPIVRQRGYFIKGKFDQFQRNIPFSAFVLAFRDLMEQLNSESDAQLERWKTAILNALGENAGVIIEVIPELERIIGPQPEVTELSGNAAQNRFNLLFQKFIKVFTTIDHPLVIFLDDLQWADSASLKLMQLLTSDAPEISYLLLLGAYRDNEVFPAHPLTLTLDEIAKSGATLKSVTLAPLERAALNTLVADTLTCSQELALPLTELVYQKTKGNPFFATQFLKSLHEDGWITFNFALGHWQCDMTQVRQLALTDDVVEFMATRLHKLPVSTQEILKVAACIGNQFDLATLAVAREESQVEVAQSLWGALQEGLVLPISDTYKFFQGTVLNTVRNCATHTQKEDFSEQKKNPFSAGFEYNQQEKVSAWDISVGYKFLHDRVQQAAYSLIPEAQKALTHWKIGQLLWQGLSQQQLEEKIFALVNQLNLGKATITSQSQRQQLAQLNLHAAEKAKLSAAYQAAQNYCDIGIELLTPKAWQTDYGLIYNLHREGSEAAYLSGNFDRAEVLYQAALEKAQTPLDKATIYRVQMTQYQLQGRNAEAIAIQRQSLQLLGWSMPAEPQSIQSSLDREIATVSRFLEQQTIESILNFTKMENDTVAEMLRILQILFYAAWLDGQVTLAMLAVAKMTVFSLEYGNSEMSPFGYVGYGLIANVLLKNAALGHQFGMVAVELGEKFDNADVRGMTNFLFAADLHSWSRPLREADIYYDNAFKYGMDAGNWLTVGFMMMQSGSDRLTYGKNLNDLYTIARAHADFLRQVKSFENLDALTVGVLQPIRNLLGLTTTDLSFDDEHFSEAEYLQRYARVPYHLAWFYSVKIRHAYLFDGRAIYSDLIPKLGIIEESVPTHGKVPSSTFYVVLMHLALIDATDDEEQRQFHWQAISPLEERLKHWARDCSDNIYHKCLLIEAEKARIRGQRLEAIERYEEAIDRAKAQEYGYEEALANELAAKFYLDWGKEKYAALHIQEAYYGYARWSAKAKVDDLEKRYPTLLAPILERQKLDLTTSATVSTLSKGTISKTTSGAGEILDLAALMKASRTLSEEICLEAAIANLIKVVRENAGAETVALMLLEEQVLMLSALIRGEDTPQIDPIPVETSNGVPMSIVNKVKRSLKALVLDNARNENALAGDAYIQQYQPLSILCLPLVDRGKLRGILYLENNRVAAAFTSDRVEVLSLLCSQAAISLENARLYQKSLNYAQQLEQTQLQLVQSEKMAVVGQLTAGVAHEINNPVGFISGNLTYTNHYIQDLMRLLNLYRQTFPLPGKEIEEEMEAIELDYLIEDLPQTIGSMKEGIDRITEISKSMRTFSRGDTAKKISFNIHDGIDSTLLILKHRLKANEHRPSIEVVKNYGNLPEINCYPGQLNQVFMNLIANAIDAFDEVNIGRTFDEIKAAPNRIVITTEVDEEKQLVIIKIKDNGMGMSNFVKEKVFEHLFTTKAVGKGTGLGLSISRQIVEEKHGGKITLISAEGKGTKFCIALPLT